MTVQDEDAEDEDALAGGEDDVESQHDPEGAGVSLGGRQLPERQRQVGYHGTDQQQQEDGVTEHLGLGEQVTSTSTTISYTTSSTTSYTSSTTASSTSSSSTLQEDRRATAEFAGRLEVSLAGRGILQLQQGIISASVL